MSDAAGADASEEPGPAPEERPHERQLRRAHRQDAHHADHVEDDERATPRHRRGRVVAACADDLGAGDAVEHAAVHAEEQRHEQRQQAQVGREPQL